MRIVSGEFRGRAIAAPKGDSTRPTTDRVREALTSSLVSLRGTLEGAIVLDAFAGSGALGLEALSRGAASATFFERDRAAANVVRENIRKCGLASERAQVVNRDAMKSSPSNSAGAFDLVFLDPPYAYAAADVLSAVASWADLGLIGPCAIIVYEHAIKDADAVSAAGQEAGLAFVALKKYGKTGVSLFNTAD